MKQPSKPGLRADSHRKPEIPPDVQQRTQEQYQPPVIITYKSEEIAEIIGPAQACTGFSDCTAEGQ